MDNDFILGVELTKRYGSRKAGILLADVNVKEIEESVGGASPRYSGSLVNERKWIARYGQRGGNTSFSTLAMENGWPLVKVEGHPHGRQPPSPVCCGWLERMPCGPRRRITQAERCPSRSMQLSSRGEYNLPSRSCTSSGIRITGRNVKAKHTEPLKTLFWATPTRRWVGPAPALGRLNVALRSKACTRRR